MLDPRSVALCGIGIGPMSMALLGLWPINYGGEQPEILPPRLKATPVAFGIQGEVIFVPWLKRTNHVNPEDVSNEIPQEFDEIEQAMMLFAVASLNS